MKRLLLVICLSAAAFAAPPDDCAALRKHGKKAEAEACYKQLAVNRDVYLSAEGYWGLGLYKEANDRFMQVTKANPKNALYHVRWGRMFLEKNQNDDADAEFDAAL